MVAGKNLISALFGEVENFLTGNEKDEERERRERTAILLSSSSLPWVPNTFHKLIIQPELLKQNSFREVSEGVGVVQ